MREIFVANTDEIEDRERVVIVDGSLEIGVFRLGDDFFAWENNCPHSGGPICQGRIMNRVIENGNVVLLNYTLKRKIPELFPVFGKLNSSLYNPCMVLIYENVFSFVIDPRIRCRQFHHQSSGQV